MESKIRDVDNALNLIKDDVKRTGGSIQEVQGILAKMVSGVATIENNMLVAEDALKHLNALSLKSKEDSQKEIDEAFDKGKEFAIKELSDTIMKNQDDERIAYNKAVAQAKEEARVELEAAVVKAREATIKELTLAITNFNVSRATFYSTPEVKQEVKQENIVNAAHLLTRDSFKVDSLTSFVTICDELIRHTTGYLRTLNNAYRIEISGVSNMFKVHRQLYSFLFGPNGMENSEAQAIIDALVFKEGTQIVPATLLAVKKAFLQLGPDIAVIEYRSLPTFLSSCSAAFNEIITRDGSLDGSQSVQLVQTALERQTAARGYLHGWETKVDAGKAPLFRIRETLSRLASLGDLRRLTINTALPSDGMRKSFEKEVFKGCLNGLRILSPMDFPDREKFKTVRTNVGLCCRCKDCRKGLGIE